MMQKVHWKKNFIRTWPFLKAFKAMEQPDHMIDMVIILSVNFCTCKIRYQVKNLWDQRKGTKGFF